MTSEFRNPAKEYIKFHTVSSLDDVTDYADFLRNQAGLSADRPIDLQKIIEHFGLHPPKPVTLPNQQGTTVPFMDIPQILVHSGDKATRQKFTIAHELIELLMQEISTGMRPDRTYETVFGSKKEQVCQKGAANLLMPRESFSQLAHQKGLSFQTGEWLAQEYEVSLMAALFRLTDVFPQKSAVVLWQMKNKPADFCQEAPESQYEMPGFHPTNLPGPQLRVAWSYGKFKDVFIPEHKSAFDDSCVITAWDCDCPTFGEEKLPFGRYNEKAFIENQPVYIEGEKIILSLIR